MGHAVGVLAMEHIAAGLVEGDRIVGPIRTYPDQAEEGSSVLPTLPAADIVQAIGRLIDEVGQGRPLDVVGVGFPGVIRDGVVEDSPNLQQMKGSALARSLADALRRARARAGAERRGCRGDGHRSHARAARTR